MYTLDQLLETLWTDYALMNKQAKGIHDLLVQKGEVVANDHIAFRTFDLDKVNVDVISKAFCHFGYSQKGEYEFEAKKLYAKHFEHPDDLYPRVFISELKVGEFSSELQEAVNSLVDQVQEPKTKELDFCVSGALWNRISFDTYNKLKDESEYAAWLSVYGFRANHFTILFNALSSFKSLDDFNQFVKDNGYKLNDSGGEIKGTPKELLEQSSTMADPVEVEFSDGIKKIPGCYYEFARRYQQEDGTLFSGFIAKSADKIFESTDNKE